MESLRRFLAPSLPPVLIEIVVAYSRISQPYFMSSTLERPGNHPVQGTLAFVARMRDGSVAMWGDSTGLQMPVGLRNVKALCATFDAYAAITEEDTVVCWGNAAEGGDVSAVADKLQQVEGICASSEAFAALRKDGTVVTWGKPEAGGDCSLVRSRLKGVETIYSCRSAFAAVLHDGSVETWGNQEFGGALPPAVKARLQGRVKSISGGEQGFAAVLEDGSVETWGTGRPTLQSEHSECCGHRFEYVPIPPQLRGVESICATDGAFAALKEDGTVVTWGLKKYGGDSSHVQKELAGVVSLSACGAAFAALKKDGRVVAWGGRRSPGPSPVPAQLRDVVAVCGTSYDFAALHENGTVTTWHGYYSDRESWVNCELGQVVSIRANAMAFAAQMRDGSVVTWGHSVFGGDSSSVPALRQPGAMVGF